VTIDTEITDESATITAGSFRLRFQRTADRWAHALELAVGGAWTTVARSVEGNADRDLPDRVVSPAFQELQLQRSEVGARALLVGQSGPHYFSAVFQVVEAAGVVQFEADIVDRCRTPVVALASTYYVALDSGAIADAGPSGILWEPADWHGGRLAFLPSGPPDPSTRIGLREAGRGAAQVQAEALIGGQNATRRWFYQWRWVPKNGTAPLAPR
jgi:hypothetical protein